MGIFTDTYIKGLKPKANRYENMRVAALVFVSPPRVLKAGFTVTR